ncbi:AMP-binding protein [Conexibacter sp. JD483]|uniref:AMP-binding protein n=1 Tax=unclassified Conexibacter TaxID=2627773 RepID=UPI00271A7A7B|nr:MULTISPECIES: AMP-binding protein [unclassified Conexibacter]MDO8185763.1 AMP-binding protein [Conexibacter sp. CPCC 205706]MDO8199140.1 AMP-binding protein [Conexibacter sp. CPCC 205762]MDR9369915.1 AMP-binding protein [Conexibacter sp. JD483]
MVDLDAWLPRSAARRPDHPALIAADGTVVTYAELHLRARRAAAALHARGVGPGDRVALRLAPGPGFATCVHAVLGLGAAVVPIDLRLSGEEQALRAAGARTVVEEPLDGPSSAEAAALRGAPERALLERFDPSAVGTVLHTSGTTSAPKPVELTISNWLWNALGSALALGLDAEDRWLCTLPLSHVGGLSILLRSAVYGTTVVLHERFEAARAAAALADPALRVTLVSLVATTLQRTLDAGLTQPPALRCALIGGGPLAPALAARAAAAGIPAAQTYGMTEACSQVCTGAPGEPETVGHALLGQRVTLAPDGEILVAGETVARGALAADGWLHTGDLGRFDANGRLIVSGRKSDLIVSGGENVAPQEVEAVLLAHPAVADAGVYGRPDDEWGEAVAAVVVVHSPVGEADLRAHVAAHLARFKVPKSISFSADPLPRTVSGKLLRRQLR